MHVQRSSCTRPVLRGTLAALALALGATAAPAQDGFVPNETVVSTRLDLFDFEFNQKRAKITWIDFKGNLWLANVDRRTGAFKPADGRGTLIDNDALTSVDLQTVGNGPEWVLGRGADRIAYTKFLPGLPRTLDNARVAVAEQLSGGSWQVRLLSDDPRNRPYTSTDQDDPSPRVSYIDERGKAYWRDVAQGSVETPLTDMAASRALAVRFAQGARAAIYPSNIQGTLQVVRNWLDTGVTEQLTYDTGLQMSSSPFVWKAPEFGNDDVLMVGADGSREVRIYRQVDKSRPEWTVIRSIRAPIEGTKLISGEPFVFGGKSYVFMSGVKPGDDFASVVYLANIDEAQPMFRQITPDTPVRSRADPEVFITEAGPQIYYYRADRRAVPPCPCMDGVFRADTGLRAAGGSAAR